MISYRRIWQISGLLLLIAASIAAFVYWPVTVEVTQPRRGQAIAVIYATGIVEPSVTLPIAPRQSGHLVELRVDEGDTVTKGQLLARLNDSDLSSTVSELTTRLAFARSYFQRLQTLNQRNLVAQVDVDRARTDLQAAEAALQRADAQRDFMTLSAPADGLIIRRDGEIGQFINVGQALFHLSCCAPLRVTAQVDEEDIARVYPGQTVLLHTDALPKQTFKATVSEITPKGDPVARSYRVRMTLEDPGELKIGMTVDTNLLAEQHDNALLIPSTALENNRVWLVVAGKLHQQSLETGISDARQTEILSGLDENAQVVTTLRDGFSEGHPALIARQP